MKKIWLGIVLALYLATAHAASAKPGALGGLDLHGLMTNIREVISPLTKLVLAISFVGGVALVFRGVGMLKTLGMMQNYMTKPGEVAGPMVYIAVGAILAYIPTATNVASTSLFDQAAARLFGNQSIQVTYSGGSSGTATSIQNVPTYEVQASAKLLQYVANKGFEWRELIDTVVVFIQFVGLVAFVRGWFIFAHAGLPGTQPGTFSKGLIHVVGGILAINFVPFMAVLASLTF